MSITYLKFISIAILISLVFFIHKQKNKLEDKLNVVQLELQRVTIELLDAHQALDDAEHKMAYQNGLLLSYEQKYYEIMQKQQRRNKQFIEMRDSDEQVEEWSRTELPYAVKRLLDNANEHTEHTTIMPKIEPLPESVK